MQYFMTSEFHYHPCAVLTIVNVCAACFTMVEPHNKWDNLL